MKVVIQCAGKKQSYAGSFKSADGNPIMFVADPSLAPFSSHAIYAHPDDISDNGVSWRVRLAEYNKYQAQSNPLGLFTAYQLYTNSAYAALVHRFGIEKVYVLSPAWGLVRADYLIPTYDISFAYHKDKYIMRTKRQTYLDLNMLADDGEDIVYIGGKNYQDMFCRLLQNHECLKTVIYNSINEPDVPRGFETILYETNIRTNWHYEFAHNLADDLVEF